MNLSTYLQAGYPGLAVITSEEARAETEIAAVCASLNRQLHAWSSTEGLVDLSEGRITQCADPLDALQIIDDMFAKSEPQTVVMLRDLQLHLEQTDPMLTRRIKDVLRIAKTNGHALILLGCRLNLPAEIDHEITRIEFGLPDSTALNAVLNVIMAASQIPNLDPAIRESALANSLGLSTTEAENVFALSVVEAKAIDPAIIAREKAKPSNATACSKSSAPRPDWPMSEGSISSRIGSSAGQGHSDHWPNPTDYPPRRDCLLSVFPAPGNH